MRDFETSFFAKYATETFSDAIYFNFVPTKTLLQLFC